MQDHKKARENIRKYNTRNDRDIKEPEESPKNTDARPKQTDHTPG